MRPYPASKPYQPNSLETVRGAALSLWHRGAQRIYLFNYMDSETTIERSADYARLLRETGDPAAMAVGPRRHVLTYADTWAVGEPQATALPAAVGAGGWHAFRLHIGPRPAAGEAGVVLALDPADGVKGDAAAVRVNGEPCGAAESVAVAKPCPVQPAWRYRVPLAALRDGYNAIEVQANAALTVTWVELAIRPHEPLTS